MPLIGDNVCHPVHGLGVIESVEEQRIQGQVVRFSVVNFRGLKVMVNEARAAGMLRPPISADETERVLEYLEQPLQPEAPRHPAQMLRDHMASVRSGDIYKVCDTVRALAASSRERKLSPQQQELLQGARLLLVEEMAHARQEPTADLERRLDERLTRAV